METFTQVAGRVAEITAVPLMVLLVGVGIFLTVKMRFFVFRYFPHIMKHTAGNMFKRGKGEGTITPFQAVASALASTVGAANIVGVPVAIALGGPGAVFWMWIVALIGMTTKYSEVVLGIKYRTQNKKGDYVGGPMYYIDRGLGWKKMAVFFAVIQLMVVFASASVQSNSVAGIMESSLQIPNFVTGLVLALLITAVMFGGIKAIGKFAEKVVPSMVIVYMTAALIVIVFNIQMVPEAFYLIFKHAFTPISAAGGFAGAGLAAILRWGIARGLYSNEAGMGSAAIAHAGARNKQPATQGFWGIFEVFIDTIVVCTVTALLILSTDAWTVIGPDQASEMTTVAMGSVFGEAIGGLIITITLFFFALTTMLMIIYYGEKQAEYLWGHGVSLVVRYIFIGSVIWGSVGSLLLVWSLLDIMLALIVVPNMIALLFLSGKVKEMTDDYFNGRSSEELREAAGEQTNNRH